jgi:hypothetical protein
MKAFVSIMMTFLSALPALADAPHVQISNDLMQVTLYLPDAANGFYRGTRFDWSGVVADLRYAGHSYYGPWFTKTDPDVSDFVYRGDDIVAGPCSAITGPVEEFGVLGYEEAKAGGTFLKIGVGILRKPDNAPYTQYRLYEIVNGGKWSVTKSQDGVEFTQELHDSSTGYGYVYWKKVSLGAGKPEMSIAHSLKNTGTRPIHTSVYDHNFLVLDKQTTGPGFSITFPYAITANPAPNKELAEVEKNQILYRRTLVGKDTVYFAIEGFGKSPDDYKIHLENADVKAGMMISGNRPLAKMSLWSIRSVIAIEPFVDVSLEPGGQSTWKYDYEYYTLPHPGGVTQR